MLIRNLHPESRKYILNAIGEILKHDVSEHKRLEEIINQLISYQLIIKSGKIEEFEF